MPDGLVADLSTQRSEHLGSADRFRIVRLENHGGQVGVLWGDGHESRFDAIWLRDNCACPACRDPSNGQRRFDVAALPTDLTIVAATAEPDSTITFTFAPDGHLARLEAAWLRAHCYSQASRQLRRSVPSLWGHELADALPEGNFSEVSASKTALARWLDNVSSLGFALLRGVPLEDGAVARVAELFGFVRETNYGRVFDVVNKSSPNNLAYTNQALRVPPDNPYRDPSPGMQLLHCLASSAAGGDTILVDGFLAAQRLRAESPQHFDLLSTHEVPFRFRDKTCDLRARDRLITVDSNAAIKAVRYNNRSFATLDLPAEIMADFYTAYRHFGRLLREPEAELTFRMTPGDLVIMINHRVLHGRQQFADGASRHLQGCYADQDALDSFIRINLATSADAD